MTALALLIACLLGADSNLRPDLAFGSRKMAGWEGSGFSWVSQDGPALALASRVSSAAAADGKGLLHTAITLPAGVKEIRFRAAAVRRSSSQPAEDLDVLLLAAGKRIIPKRVMTARGWQIVEHLLTAESVELHQYSWSVADLAGRPVRIALVDDDSNSGAYVICTGFTLVEGDSPVDAAFEQEAIRYAQDKRLASMMRLDSAHFLAMSNADEQFSNLRLQNCELMYVQFFDHFRRKGFVLQEPAGKLHAAIFDTQAGFEGFVGHKVSSQTTGIYLFQSNRLAMYDFATNRTFAATRQKVEDQGKQIGLQLNRMRYLDSVNHRADEFQRTINISTVMHETAHQLSFNSGLLNRGADTPLWLAEGLACYCEATSNSAWQGIGAPNPERMASLHKAVGGAARSASDRTERAQDKAAANGSGLVPLRSMVESDDWAFKQGEGADPLRAYAQSWALFRWLMEEKAASLSVYLSLVAQRRTPDLRLADFQQAFGRDLRSLQTQYERYVRDLTRRYP
jgi:Protein of unknown function (DUF1570)